MIDTVDPIDPNIASGYQTITVPRGIRRLLKGVNKLDTLDKVCANAAMLAPFEMRTLLDPEEIAIAVEERLGHVGRAIETIRNIGILIPIVLTWLSLAAASDAYEQSITQDKSLTETPFLQQWQAGFPLVKSITVGPWHRSIVDGHNHWFTFGNFAFVDAVVLGILLVLTVIGQLSSLWAFWRSKAVYNKLNQLLFNLNFNASGMLAFNPSTARTDTESRELFAALRAIETAMNEVRDVTNAQARNNADWKDEIERVHNAVRNMGKIIQLASEASGPFQNVVEDMERHARDLSQRWDLIVRLLSQVAGTTDPEIRRLLDQYFRSQQLPYKSPQTRQKRRGLFAFIGNLFRRRP